MIAIPKELRQAVQESEDNLVRLIDPETNVEYVVLPAEKFTQIQTVLYDDSPLIWLSSTSEIARTNLVFRVGSWDDPEWT